MRQRRGVRQGAAAVIIGVAVHGAVGCSSGDLPDDMSESASAAPSATWTPAPLPPRPERPVQEYSDESAKAMLRYVLELHDYAYATGDASGFESLCAKECTFCQNVITDVSEIAENSRQVDGKEIDVLDIGALRISDTTYLVEAQVNQSANTTRAADGTVVENFPAEKSDLAVALVWADDFWQVRVFGVDKVKESAS